MSTTACAAVGHASPFGHSVDPLAEAWDGASWTIQPTVGVGQASVLSGVWCANVSTCVAVGSGDASTLAERREGTSWAFEPTPDPAGARFPTLAGVSCPSAAACEAVGSYADEGGAGSTLAESRNGGSWAIQSTPSPTEHASLSGVSCTSATACTAVGSR